MTATTEPRGGFDYGWDPGEDGWGPNMNANLLRLSRFGFHASALSMTTTAPPGSPTSGAGYIIPAGATGPWADKTGQVAVWDGSAWAYAVPRNGWTIHVVNVGLVVYEDGAWSQSNLATASGVGAEPYAGVPAQASFWRSTAAGVRAWVQLVAADITDLATTLAAYLTKASPTFTGRLSGNDVMIGGGTTSGWLQLVANNTGSGTFNVDFLGGASSNRRMTFRWSDANDTLIAMSSNDDGSARLDRVIIPRSSALPIAVASGLNVSTGDLSVGGVAIADSSRNGSFAGLTASGTISGPRATLSEFGVLREYVGLSTIGALYPTGVTPTGSNYAIAIHDDGSKTYVGAATETGFVIAGNLKLTATASAVNLGSAVELQQNGTTRITAGGDGRFASLRASGLAASSTHLTRLDANGELIASPVKVAPGVGVVFEQAASLQAGGGTWGGSTYTSWTPSAIVPIADDSSGNAMASLGTGYIWNSQRLNALTITDGAAATPYRGRIKADRWVAYSTQIIQNTTSVTSWFAAGVGDGSPTIPAGSYLKQGRRVRVEGRIFCPSCAADTAPEISLKVGSTTLWTRSKAFTIAAGNEIFIDVRANIFIDDENRLIVVGDVDFYAFATGNYTFKHGGQIDPYNGTVANTIDITIKPSSTSEIWVRSFAFIEI